jgi:hypothetical protein
MPHFVVASLLFSFLPYFFLLSHPHSFCYQLSPSHVFAVFKSYVFWDTAPCSPLKVKRRFGGTYRHHLHGRIISQARKQLGLFFDPEDGGNIFLRNVGRLATDYTALYARREQTS